MWKQLIEILNYSNTFISVAAAFLTYGVTIQIGGNDALFYSVFVFFSTLATYNFQRILRADELIHFESHFLNWIRTNKRIISVLILISITYDLVAFVVYFKELKPVFLFLVISMILSVLYVVSVKGHSLRSIACFKMYLIAIVWTLAVGVVPLILQEQISNEKIIFVIAHFFLIVGLCVPFDVRDLVYDSPTLKTLPQLVGIHWSKVISVVFVGLYYYLSFYLVGWSLIHFVYFLLLILLLLNMSQKRSVNYYLIIDLSIGLLGCIYVIL